MEDALSPEIQGLLRQAAELGPGYHGRKRIASATEREAVRNALIEFKQEVPAYLDAGEKWVERRAKLFEAGAYPDKGVSISEEQLIGLADGFDLPVPVLIEHAASPLELGYLTSVEAIGRELFGVISLTPEANALVERSGAKALSIGLSPELDAIREVSLVRKPRVESAQLFSGALEASEDSEAPSPNSYLPAGEKGALGWRQRYERLERETRDKEVDREVSDLVRDGRLTPAQAPFAAAILSADGAIEFDGGKAPLRQLLIAMLERQPPHQLFAELAAQPKGDVGRALLLPEEAAFYEKHFPGVSLETIAAMR